MTQRFDAARGGLPLDAGNTWLSVLPLKMAVLIAAGVLLAAMVFGVPAAQAARLASDATMEEVFQSLEAAAAEHNPPKPGAAQQAATQEKTEKQPQIKQNAPREKTEKQLQMEALEAKQPPAVLRDKYMISLSRLLKEQKFSEALPYFDKLESLQIAKDPLLDYYHGEALYKTGQPEQALQMFYRYIETQGSCAPLYQKSLEMTINIEHDLTAAPKK